jgi:hypothetical protein
MKRWIVLGLAVFGIACLAQTIATPIPVVTVTTGLPGTPYSIPACQPTPGISLKLQKISDTLIELIAMGLRPGESPSVYYNTPVGDTPGTGGSYQTDTVNEDGKFLLELQNLEPPFGQTSATWDIRLAHERGVECATITLP